MRRQRHQVHVQGLDVQAECSSGLHGVGVEWNLVSTGDLADLGNGLDGAHFVVGVHDADEGRVRADGLLDVGRIDQAMMIHRHVGHLKAKVLLQLLQRVADGVVLDRRGDDVVLFGTVTSLKGHAAQRQIVALGAATGKDHLSGAAVQDAGHGLARLVHGVVGLAPQGVDAGSVAILLGPVGQHGLHHPWIDGGCGSVVQVNSSSRSLLHGLLSHFIVFFYCSRQTAPC